MDERRIVHSSQDVTLNESKSKAILHTNTGKHGGRCNKQHFKTLLPYLTTICLLCSASCTVNVCVCANVCLLNTACISGSD